MRKPNLLLCLLGNSSSESVPSDYSSDYEDRGQETGHQAQGVWFVDEGPRGNG